jgi:hypothetical protein
VGHNFRRILAWLRDFLRLILTALIAAIRVQSASDQLLNGRLFSLDGREHHWGKRKLERDD